MAQHMDSFAIVALPAIGSTRPALVHNNKCLSWIACKEQAQRKFPSIVMTIKTHWV